MSRWDDHDQLLADRESQIERIREQVREEEPGLPEDAVEAIAHELYEDGSYHEEPDWDVSDGEVCCAGTYLEVNQDHLGQLVKRERQKMWLRPTMARAIRPMPHTIVRTRVARAPRGRRVAATASRSAGGGSCGRPRPSDDDPALAGALYAAGGGGLQ